MANKQTNKERSKAKAKENAAPISNANTQPETEEVSHNNSEVNSTKKQFNIICFGDSITEGKEFPEDLRWPALLQEMLEEYQTGKYIVHNRGVANDTTALALDRFADDILPLLPGMVLIQFGLNDANIYEWARKPRVGISEFRKNLREFYRIITRNRGTCVFLVNHAIGEVLGRQGNRQSFYDNFQPYNDAIRVVAKQMRTPYIDLYEIIKEKQINLDYFVSLDKLHLTLEGNQKYAAMVYESITGEEYIHVEYDDI